MAAKRRKPGDWKSIVAARVQRAKGNFEITNGHGLSNIPSIGDVGSAAYRRRAR